MVVVNYDKLSSAAKANVKAAGLEIKQKSVSKSSSRSNKVEKKAEVATDNELLKKQELLKKSGLPYDVESAKKAILVSSEEYKKVVEQEAIKKTPEYKAQQEREMLGKVQEGLAASAKRVEEMKRVAPEYKSSLQALQSGAMGTTGYVVTPSGAVVIGGEKAAAVVESIEAPKKALADQQAFESMLSKVQKGLAASVATRPLVKSSVESKFTSFATPAISDVPTQLSPARASAEAKIASVTTPLRDITAIQEKIGLPTSMSGITTGFTLGGDKKYTFYTATEIGNLKTVDAVPKKLLTTDPMGVETIRQKLCGDNNVCGDYDVTYKSGQVTDLSYVPRTRSTENDWESKRKASISNVPENVLKELEKPYEDPFGKYKYTVTNDNILRYQAPKTTGVWDKIVQLIAPPWVERKPYTISPVTVQSGAMEGITGGVITPGISTTTLVTPEKMQTLTGVGMRGVTGSATLLDAFKTTPVASTYKSTTPTIQNMMSTAPITYGIPEGGIKSYPGYSVTAQVLPGLSVVPEKLMRELTSTSQIPKELLPVTTTEAESLSKSIKPQIDLTQKYFFDETAVKREQERIKKAGEAAYERLGGRMQEIGKEWSTLSAPVDAYTKKTETANQINDEYNKIYNEYKSLKPEDYENRALLYQQQRNLYETALKNEDEMIGTEKTLDVYKNLMAEKEQLDETYKLLSSKESEVAKKYNELQKVLPTAKEEQTATNAYERIKQLEKERAIIFETMGGKTAEGQTIYGEIPSQIGRYMEQVKEIDPFYAKQQEWKYAMEHMEPTLTGKGVRDVEFDKKLQKYGLGDLVTLDKMKDSAPAKERKIASPIAGIVASKIAGSTVGPMVGKIATAIAGTTPREVAGAIVGTTTRAGLAVFETPRNIMLGTMVEPERAKQRDVAKYGSVGAAGLSMIPGLNIARGVYDPLQGKATSDESWTTRFRGKALEGDVQLAFMLYGGLAQPATKTLTTTAKTITMPILKGVGLGLTALPVAIEGVKYATGQETGMGAIGNVGEYSGKVLSTIGGISAIKKGPLYYYEAKIPTPKAGEPETIAKGLGLRFWTGRQYVGGPLVSGTRGATGSWRVSFGTPETLYTSQGTEAGQAIAQTRYVTIGSKTYAVQSGKDGGLGTVKVGSKTFTVQTDPNAPGYEEWLSYKGKTVTAGGKPVIVESPGVRATYPAEEKILSQAIKSQLAEGQYQRMDLRDIDKYLQFVSGKSEGQVLTQDLKSMPKAEAERVLKQLTQYKNVMQEMYGSSVAKQQMGDTFWVRARGTGAKAGDFDVQTFLDKTDANKLANIIGADLKTTLGAKNVQVTEGLVQTKVGNKWVNAVDIHPLTPDEMKGPASLLTSEPTSYGLMKSTATYEMPITKGGPKLPVSTLGQQIIGGQEQVLLARPTGQGIIYAPETHRLKDIPTYFAAAEKGLAIKAETSMFPGKYEKMATQLESIKSTYPQKLFPEEAWQPLSLGRTTVTSTPWTASILGSSATTGFDTGFGRAIWSIQDFLAGKTISTKAAPTMNLKIPTITSASELAAPSAYYPSFDFLKTSGLFSTSPPTKSSPSQYLTTPSISSSISKAISSSLSPSKSPSSPSPYISPIISSPVSPSSPSKGSSGSSTSPSSPSSPISPVSPSPSPVSRYLGFKYPGLPETGYGQWPTMGSAGNAWAGVSEWTITNPIRDLPGEWLAAQKNKDITELSGVGLGSGLVPKVSMVPSEMIRSGGKISHHNMRLYHNLKMPHIKIGMPHMNMGMQYINTGMQSFNFKQPKQEIQLTGYDRAKSAVNKMFNAEGLSNKKVKLLMRRGKHGKII